MSPAAGEGADGRGDVRAGGGIARSASIVSLGNIASRVFGLAREAVISYYFGASGELSAFKLAARVPTMIYDLLVGGMLSAALVPVFSEYARHERRQELARVASAFLSIIAVAMAFVVLGIELFATPLAGILSDFADPHLKLVLANCLRVIAPAALFFGLTGGATGLLYALRRFSFTAVSAAVFNLGIVLLTPLLAPRLPADVRIYVLPLGIVLGSLLQLGVTSLGHTGRPGALQHRMAASRHSPHRAALRAPHARADRHPVPNHRRQPLGVGHGRAERQLDGATRRR